MAPIYTLVHLEFIQHIIDTCILEEEKRKHFLFDMHLQFKTTIKREMHITGI
jgi:hypothetical protein